MKIQVQRQEFLDFLKQCQGIAEKNSTKPELSNFKLEANKKTGKLTLFSTNLQVSVLSETDCDIEEEGCVVVDSSKIFSLIREFKDEPICLKTKSSDRLVITQGSSKYNLVYFPENKYPHPVKINIDEGTQIESDILKKMIRKTMYSVSKDNTRIFLNGIYFQSTTGKNKTYRMVSTDGHRLSKVESENSHNTKFSKGIIIPKKGLEEILKVLETYSGTVSIGVDKNYFFMKNDTTVITVRLIEHDYPDYERLIPKKVDHTVTFNRENLLSCLKRVELLANEKSKGVIFSFGDDKVNITSKNPELGEANEEVTILEGIKNKNVTIGFNARYIMDILKNIEDENIEFNIIDKEKPTVVTPKVDPSYKCIVMPMRI